MLLISDDRALYDRLQNSQEEDESQFAPRSTYAAGKDAIAAGLTAAAVPTTSVIPSEVSRLARWFWPGTWWTPLMLARVLG